MLFMVLDRRKTLYEFLKNMEKELKKKSEVVHINKKRDMPVIYIYA